MKKKTNNLFEKILKDKLGPQLIEFRQSYFIILSFLFAILVAFIDGIIDFYIFDIEESLWDSLFDLNAFELYIRSMIVVTFTIFGILTSMFISKIRDEKLNLSKSELMFRTITNYTRDWIYWITPQKKLNFISSSTKEITGYSQEEFLVNPELIDDIIFEEDKQLFINHEHDSLKGNNLSEIEFRILTKSNQIKWLHHNCQAIFDSQEVYLGHRVSNRDITKLINVQNDLCLLSQKLKLTNEKLNELVNQRTTEINMFMTQCPYPRIIYDQSGNLISCNPSWVNQFSSQIDESIYNNPLIKEDKLKEKVREILVSGKEYKSYPIYYEQFDKLLVLDFYAIRNSNYEVEKIVLNVEDITDQTRSKELSEELEQRRDIIGEIFEFLDAERKHIAKELHDKIGQNLMLIKLNSELQKEIMHYDSDKNDEIINLINETTKEFRSIIYSLYPEEIDKYGLVESINNMISRITDLSRINIDIKIYGKYHTLRKRIELTIFRVIQETLNNITKHSRAKHAKVEIYFKSNFITCVVSDDGIGFDTKISDNNKYGLKFMEERIDSIGGHIEINSNNEFGTTIHFEIPLS